MKKQTKEELETETTTSGGMGSYPKNANGWETQPRKPKEYVDFPLGKDLDLSDDPKYRDLNEEESKEIDNAIFEPVEFHLLSRNAKKFLLGNDSTSVRSILHASHCMQVPLHNLVSTFYTNSLSVLRIAEEVMSQGSFVKVINFGPEWFVLIVTYRGIDFAIFNAVYGNPLPDPKDSYQLCLTIKYSDMEMMPLAFPELEFKLVDTGNPPLTQFNTYE